MTRRNRLANRARDDLWLLGIVGVFVLALGVLAIWFSAADDSELTVLEAGTDLHFSRTDLKEGELHLFIYPIDSSTGAQLVVQRAKDGPLRVAFASCRRCYGLRHYKWWGQLICGHCGHAMKLPDPGEELTEETGCMLVPLPYSIQGDQLVVHGRAIREEFDRWFQPTADTESN